MQALENFISSHPMLMNVNLFLVYYFGCSVLVVPCALFMAFGNLKDKNMTWSTPAGKCFRLGMLSALAGWFALGFDGWQRPGKTDITPITGILIGLWVLSLFATGILDFKNTKQRFIDRKQRQSAIDAKITD